MRRRWESNPQDSYEPRFSEPFEYRCRTPPVKRIITGEMWVEQHPRLLRVWIAPFGTFIGHLLARSAGNYLRCYNLPKI